MTKISQSLKPFSLAVAMGALLLTTGSFASVVIKVDPDKRVRLPISYDSMNRIAFANDRIAQIFGDEEAYTLQTDETRGQIFLKPTEANGEKPISLTLTTEQGKVQDLELTPQKIPTSTIILKGDPFKGDGENKPPADQFTQPQRKTGEWGNPTTSPFSNLGSPYPERSMTPVTDRTAHLMRAIREVAGQEIVTASEETDKPHPIAAMNLKVEGIRVIHQQGLSVSVYAITNTSDEVHEVVENAFSGDAVLAIAVENRHIKPAGSTRLFVIRAV